MLFIGILLLFLYEVDSYLVRIEYTNQIYRTLMSLHKFWSLITLVLVIGINYDYYRFL